MTLYRQVEQSIHAWIEEGRLVPGDQVPTTKQLCKIFGDINHQTVRKAITSLASRGLVTATRGQGTFVSTTRILHHRVCLSFPNFAEEFPLRIGEAAGRHLIRAGLDTTWRSSYSVPSEELENLQRLPSLKIDGAIIYPMRSGHSASALYELRRKDYPFVVVDNTFPDLRADAVLCDEKDGAKELTLRIIQSGRKGIFWVGSDIPAYRLGRYGGFQDAFSEAGYLLDKNLIFLAHHGTDLNAPEQLDAVVEKILHLGNRVNAVIAQDDMFAIKIAARLRRKGARIPEDYLIAGFGGLAIAQELEPSMISVVQPMENMGVEAARLLVELMNSPGKAPETILLPTQIRMPESGSIL